LGGFSVCGVSWAGMPTLQTQQKIAFILFAYDYFIENNNHIAIL
jgi:hypothetical protein